MRIRFFFFSFLIIIYAQIIAAFSQETSKQPYLIILGIAQDAGYPQAACTKDCCKDAWKEPSKKRYTACLGIVDPQLNKTWMIDATPDFKEQLHLLNTSADLADNKLPDAIFLTHAHIGHYTGLMHLGREAIGSKDLPVYALPRMSDFLQKNGPWEQLVKLKNIKVNTIREEQTIAITDSITISAFEVPHRDEYSETAGYLIKSPGKSIMYIPDIDKWHLWDKNLNRELKNVEVAIIDATFYKNGEIPGRDMTEIPHPFVEETMLITKELSPAQKAKIHFIHLNHTNPLLNHASKEYKIVTKAGYNISKQGQKFEL